MAFVREYSPSDITRADIDAGSGWVLLEFGTDWCGHCSAAQPLLQKFLGGYDATHLKVEDGKGRPLGRSFAVKMWPTVILLRDGREIARAVRPHERDDLAPLIDALERGQ
jgi:thioredoxin 1